jgi:hypothetical protein
MKAIGQTKHIDYWHNPYVVQRGLKNYFGVRVRDGQCWALVQIGGDEASTFGEPHEIPVDLSILPMYLRIIIEEHRLAHPNSDLLDVLAGKKTFEEAIRSRTKIGPKRTSASAAVRLPNAS